jgi:hypothetical protein
VSLAFLSPTTCAEGTTTSPLRRALEGADPTQVRDLSLEGIVEIRGGVDSVTPGAGEELLRLSPRRGFLFTADDPVAVADRLRATGVLAYDATGAYAGIAIASEQVVRRLSDLDLESIPTAGPFAHVTALFRRDADGWFLVYVPQELGHYVAEAAVDAIAGLNR